MKNIYIPHFCRYNCTVTSTDPQCPDIEDELDRIFQQRSESTLQDIKLLKSQLVISNQEVNDKIENIKKAEKKLKIELNKIENNACIYCIDIRDICGICLDQRLRSAGKWVLVIIFMCFAMVIICYITKMVWWYLLLYKAESGSQEIINLAKQYLEK